MYSSVKTLFFLIALIVAPALFGQYSESDWKDRDQWMNPEQIFKMANIEQGDDIADVGCHQGYMSVHLAEYIGDKGKVFSVDVREDRLTSLKEIALERGIKNIQTILGDYDDPKLPENSLDVVLIIDAYHEMKDYREILQHAKKALKPNGRILILEKLKSEMIGKSRQEQTKAHTLSPEYVENELKEVGFEVTRIEKDLGNWERNSQKKIWVMVGVLPES